METAAAKTYNIAHAFIGEIQYEAIATKKCLERVPEDKFDYKPHEKSFTMIRLAGQIAEMFEWITVTCTTSELDFAKGDYKPIEPTTTAELVEHLEKNLATAIETLKQTSDDEMMKDWTLKNGEATYFTMPKVQVIRSFALNHIINHRGQLSVYLRLNDIPVPSMYGPSADEGQM